MAQITVSGTVFDSSKIIPVKGVIVKSNGGQIATTDSLGRYSISTSENDSLSFVYNDKPTIKFSVKQIEDYSRFDISLRIRMYEKYRSLKEVKVFAKSFKQDSIENRERYAKIFDYTRPGISTTTSTYSGVPGMDLDEFINIFKFKKNRQTRKMQERLMKEEEDKYIDYRFSKHTVGRITRLEGEELDEFVKLYRPDYYFTMNSSLPDFYQYILNSSYEFKKQLAARKVQVPETKQVHE
ncbi:MAG: hypothetical protein V4556_04530 [Bacteroidota bacterium]